MGFSGNCEKLIISVLAVLAFSAVLFIDFAPVPFGGYADQRFVLVLLSGLLVISAATGFFFMPNMLVRGLMVFAPTLLLSLAFCLVAFAFRSQPYVWVEPGMYGFFFLAPVMAGFALGVTGDVDRFIETLLLIIAVLCGFYGLATINVYLFAITDRATNLVDFIPWGFVNIRYWSHIATWCLPLMPLAVLVGPLKRNRLWRFGVMLGAGLWWWMLFMTTSRGSALGIAFGVAIAVILMGRSSLPWLRVCLSYCAVGVMLWLVLSLIIPSFIADEIQVSSIKLNDSGRWPMFLEAWAMSFQHFPFGMGPQSWLTHDILNESSGASGRIGHPHNMYLMWAAEYGWALIAVLGLVVVQAIRYFWQKRAEVLSAGDNERALMLVGFTAATSAALFHAGVSAVFMAPGSMLIGLFVLVAFWALIIPAHRTDMLLNRTEWGTLVLRGAATFLCLAFSILWLLWASAVVKYFGDMRQDEIQYAEESAGPMLPRFWFHGNFPRRAESSSVSE